MRMTPKSRPRTWFVRKILYKRKEIGTIQLVNYLNGSRPHIELYLQKEYRNTGIMKKELKLYLKKCKEYTYTRQIIAVVKQDNIPSIKLLEQNGFIKVSNIEENIIYIIDLNFRKEDFIKAVALSEKAFPIRRKYD